MKDEDLIRRKMVAILRLANQSAKPKDPYALYSDFGIQNDELMNVIANLSPVEKKTMIDVILAYTLLTAGTVAIVRKPSRYGDPKFGDPPTLRDILSPPFRQIFRIMREKIPVFPTKEHYEMANKLLPIIGSEAVEWHDLPDELVAGHSEELKGPDQTWRGMTNLPKRLLMGALRPNASWNIKRGVSTTTDRSTAISTFAGIDEVQPGVFDSSGLLNGTSSMLLRFINKKGVGGIVQNLSSFPHEREVILSGVGTIKNWSLQFAAIKEGYDKGPVNRQLSQGAVVHVSLNNLPDKSNIEIRSFNSSGPKPGENEIRSLNTDGPGPGEIERTINLSPRDVYRIARTIMSQGFVKADLIDGISDFVGSGKNNPGFIMIVDAEIS